MDKVALHAQQEMDEEILYYVRQAQGMAPVTCESVTSFLRRGIGRETTETQVRDRLGYLTDAGLLRRSREWLAGGELTHYGITALGMDTLDGVAPPRNWR